LTTEVVDGTDVDRVYALSRAAIETVRAGGGPFFIESRTSRWPGGYAAAPSLAQTGETDVSWAWSPELAPQPVRRWVEQSDPLLLFARRLLQTGGVDQPGLAAVDARVRAELSQAVDFALRSAELPAAAAGEFALAPALS
jgi:TPP-dependent pyruvate/acetoin dehydrogenase alpha subunit